MKKMKLKMKKGMARLLAVIMVIGILPMVPNNMATVHAAEPSTTTYATKKQLMNWDYANTTGKIIFGKDSSGALMEWYILGSDTSVSGDNTAIFATSPIATGEFEADYSSNKTYNASFGTYESEPSEVYPNHYGASDLRATLNGMVASNNTTYFTNAEKSLMQATTVTTTDTKNNVSYTTTDILYALHEDSSNNDTTLYAGSNNDKALQMSTYWNSGDWFWLRTPMDNDRWNARVAISGRFVLVNSVAGGGAVQPASNLNLSSAIFASAASAASSENVVAGIIQTDTAMTLRLDGSSQNIGNVIYDSAQGEQIFVKKSAGATGTVSLVVQGNVESADWYYSKVITGGEIVSMSDIKTELNLSSDISVKDCKIWLETTVDGVTYANECTDGTYTMISQFDLSIDAPVAGSPLDTQAETTQSGLTTTTPAVTWKNGTENVKGNADYATAYTAYTTLETSEYCVFASDVTIKVNGSPATVVTNEDVSFTVSFEFPETDDDKLISITQPQPITVANGTAYADMNLPTTVAIVTEGGSVTSANVTWNTTAPISGSYDPSVLTEQRVTLAGTVICPDGVDANGVILETKITITISAAGVTGATTANPEDDVTPSEDPDTEDSTPNSGEEDPKPGDPTPNSGEEDPDTEDPTLNPNDDDTTTGKTEDEDGKDEVPDTGDTSSPMIPFMLMLVSMLGCIFILMTNGRTGKKYEKK